MSQEQLADRIGSTKSSVSRWETGERDITLGALAAIAEVLHCTVTDLIEDPGHPASILARMDDAARRRAIRLIEAIEAESTG